MSTLELRIPPVPLALAVGGAMWLASGRMPAPALALPGRVAIAVLLGGAGIALALAGVVAFRKAMTSFNPLRPGAASVLVTSGVYRLSRNPMYLGLVLALVGWAVLLADGAGLLFPVAYAAYLDRFQIRPEEAALAAKFGGDFAAYRRTVRRWL